MNERDKYIKDFDGWNNEKKLLDASVITEDILFNEGELWWASLGVNIGREIDGKHNQFERPVLVVRKFSADTLWVIPATGTRKIGTYFESISYNGENITFVLIQMRLVSSGRLLRKIGKINPVDLEKLKNKISCLLLEKRNTAPWR